MKKIDKIILKETRYIALWVIIFSAITEAIFLVIGKWDITVLLGNIVSGGVAVLNFFLMGVAVQKALTKDAKDAKTAMRASSMMRMFAIFVVIGLCLILKVNERHIFSAWTLIIPLFFPRIAVAFRPVFDKSMRKGNDTVKKDSDEGSEKSDEKEEENANES